MIELYGIIPLMLIFSKICLSCYSKVDEFWCSYLHQWKFKNVL